MNTNSGQPPKEARRVLVDGRVQGVGFRYFTLRQANRLGISGWVRNLRDGRVEIHAEAPPADLESFLAAIRRGPSMAFVSECHESPVVCEECTFFTIKD